MADDSQRVDSIAVVGGGDAGLFTALALEKGLESTDIVVIDDFENSVPEVGKSTLLSLVHFLHSKLEIDASRLVSEVRLAWKATVYFEDWCGEELHSPLGKPLPLVRQVDSGPGVESRIGGKPLTPLNETEFEEFYYRYQHDEFSTMYRELAETPGKSPMVIDRDDVFGVEKGLPDAAYHFDSRSLNEFLRTVSRERGVDLVNDRITEVATSDGRIDRIASDTEAYTADLYVDASGFKRLLMSELDNGFDEFDLPVDSAVVTTTDIPLSEVVSATVVTSGDAGWFWQIDTPGLRDLGYVYSTDHISDEEATREFVETRDEAFDADDVRRYRFDSGVLEEPWVGNCVAAGNALGFVEPLQSTALTTSARLADRLATLLGKHGRVNNEGVRELFNETTRATWEEVYDFVSLYYKYSSGTTEFWEDAREVNPGPIPQVEAYQNSGFSATDEIDSFTRTNTDLNPYYLYCLVLRGLGVESEFYEGVDLDADPDTVEQIEEYTDSLPERVDSFLSYEEFFASFHPGYD